MSLCYLAVCVCVCVCFREGLSGATVQQQQQQQQRSGGTRRDDNDDETQLSLKCQTEGRPTPSVEWLRNYIRSVARMTVNPFSAAAAAHRHCSPGITCSWQCPGRLLGLSNHLSINKDLVTSIDLNDDRDDMFRHSESNESIGP